MKRMAFQVGLAVGLLGILILVAAPATAKKPLGDSHDKKGRGSQKADGQQSSQRMQSEDRGRQSPGPGDQHHTERRDQDAGNRHADQHHRASRRDDRYDRHFANHDRSPIDRYYSEHYRHGRCPPGLRKKGHDCIAPQHARRWVRHQPLPRDVIFYDLPQDVLVHLGPPPPHHRFVRVAQDILLITVGTGIVIDAIENLGRGR